MGERRKRKSLWDVESETTRFSGTNDHNSLTEKERSQNAGTHYHELSASELHTSVKPRGHSGQQSWKSVEQKAVAMDGNDMKSRQNAPEGKEIGGRNRDFRNTSTGFEGIEHHKYHALETGRSHSHRNVGRGRSRSRSRNRGRSRSRSFSRSRGTERERGRGRSRSRSSSRSDGSARGLRRNHSPRGDYRRQSTWSDRRGLPDKSSQICKDFAAGRCRRGSNCRFLHPENVTREDGDHLSCNAGESRRKTADPDQISKHSFSRDSGTDSRTGVSDYYHGQLDEQYPKTRNAGHCNDFMKGKCRRGETCRFSHHFGSDEASEKGSRHTNFDKETGKQNEKNGKPLCKYFAAGKCAWDNCRFSHEDPKFNSLGGWSGEVTNERSLHDKWATWKGPTWDDPTETSDNVNPAGGWDGTNFPVAMSTNDTTNAKNENSWSCSVENENKGSRIPEWTDNMNQANEPLPSGGIGGYGGEVGNDGYFAKEKLSTRQGHDMLHGSLSQNQEGHNVLPEEQNFSMTAWQQDVSRIPQIQQPHHGVMENSLGSSLPSNSLDTVVNSANTTQPISFTEQRSNQNDDNAFRGNSSILNGTDSVQNTHSLNSTNESTGDLKEPEKHPVIPSSLHSQLQNDLKTFPMTDNLERNVQHFFPNLSSSEQYSLLKNSITAVSGEHVAPVTTPNVLLDQRFVNEQPQKNANTEDFNYSSMASFSVASGNVPFANTNNVQLDLVKLSRNLIAPVESGRGMNENGNSGEPDNEMLTRQSSALSIVGNKPNDSGSPNPKGDTAQANPVDAGNGAASNENMGVPDSKNAETLDSHGKPEENSAKDDKGVRLFKNSLVDFVKDILKPTWKEGKMSREIYKNIVKKVVDKVTTTIQADHIKTQEKVDQYLAYSKPKIAKLVKAYVERSLKTDS